MKLVITTLASTLIAFSAHAVDFDHSAQSNEVVKTQRDNLAKNTNELGFGPQSPRDIDSKEGVNKRIFSSAPSYTEMNLCNIHFHKNAEHKGGEFTQYAGDGDGKGYGTGYKYSGNLTAKELSPLDYKICPSEHSTLIPGDTIEVHYVHSSAQVKPGPTLGACLSDAVVNPQLRVETQVYVLVNDDQAADFSKLTKHSVVNDLHQAINIPSDTGIPVQYEGSTTGPSHNEKASPLKVSWSVRPQVHKVDIRSVGEWCKQNTFDEDHAHGVRNLVLNPELLSKIE